MADIKEPIKIRRKQLANGNISLYLDIYHNGRREYEFLKLYLIPEKTRADKEKNRQTLQLANSIKAKRIVDIQNGDHGFKSPFAEEVRFFDCTKMIQNEETYINSKEFFSRRRSLSFPFE